jgi:hypothetical protein
LKQEQEQEKRAKVTDQTPECPTKDALSRMEIGDRTDRIVFAIQEVEKHNKNNDFLVS